MEAPLRWIQPGEEDLTGKVWERGTPWLEPDEEWIRDQVEIQGKSVEEIAEQTSASVYCVKKWLSHHGIEVRQRARGWPKGKKRSKLYRTRSDKGKKRGPQRNPCKSGRSDKGKKRGPNRRRPSPRMPESIKERAKRVRIETDTGGS